MEERLGSAGEGRMAVATSGNISIWDARSMLVESSVCFDYCNAIQSWGGLKCVGTLNFHLL